MPLGTPLSPQSYGAPTTPKPPPRPTRNPDTGGTRIGSGAGTGGTMSAYGTGQYVSGSEPQGPNSGYSSSYNPQSGSGSTGDPYLDFLRAMGVGYQGDQSAAGQGFDLQNMLAGGYRDLGVNQLNQQYGFDRARAGEHEYRDVDLKRLESDRAKQLLDEQLGADNANYQALAGFAGRGLGNTMGYLNEQGGFNQRDLQQAVDYLAQQGGFAGQALDLLRGGNETQRGFVGRAQQGANTRTQMARDEAGRAARGDQATRGSSLSQGAMAKRGELDKQLAAGFSDSQLTSDNAMAGLAQSDRTGELNYNEKIAGYNNQGANARLGYDEKAASLGNQGANAQLGYDETISGIDYDAGNTQRGYDKDVGAIKDNNAYLDSVAREYGIGRDEMAASLKNGVEKLGLDYNQTLATIAQARGSSDAQFRAAGLALEQQALDYSMNGAVNVPASTAQQPRTPGQIATSMREGASELSPGAPTSTAYRQYLNRQGRAGTNPAQDDLPPGEQVWTAGF